MSANPHGSARRVVTGVDALGKSVVVEDAIVARDKGALVLWGADAPTIAGDAATPATVSWWPPPSGVRVSLATRPPDVAPTEAAPAAWPDINDAAGFHASDSVDVIVMVSGRVWLELDDGVEIELGPGDSLVQNGARHRWRNRSDEWPLMAVVIVGAIPAAARE